jgi:ATP-dependent helicase/nuclease subunit B
MAYLNVLRHWPDPRAMFGAGRLVPAGVFYVNLKGKYEPAHHRTEALADLEQARKIAYRHNGRFDMTLLPHLDARPNAGKGDQFNYRLTDAGEIHRNCKDPVPAAEFKSMLDSAEASLKKMGAKIFSGIIEVSPYRKQNIKACAQCNFSAICRIDPWTHRYRLLNSTDEPEPEEESAS